MKKFFSICLLTLSLSAHAATTVVQPNEVRTTPIILPDFADRAYIANEGVLTNSTLLGNAIQMNNNSQVTVNDGTIFTPVGSFANGVIVNGAGGLVVNNGYMEVDGYGISGNGPNATIFNNGQLISHYISGISARSAADGSVLVNNGSIYSGIGRGFFVDSVDNINILNNGVVEAVTAIASSNAVNQIIVNNGFLLSPSFLTVNLAGLTNLSFINNGLVRAENSAAIVLQQVNDSLVINNGTILALNGAGLADAIFVFGADNVTIVNTELIHTIGPSGRGIRISDTASVNTAIINSGTIIAELSNAIEVNGLNTSLTLLVGSNIQGTVALNELTSVAVERGLNLALTLTPTSVGFGPLFIDAPFVLIGDTLAVYDPTGLGMQTDVLADLSDTVLNDIYRRRTGFACPCACSEPELWIAGIGSWRKRSEQRNIGYKNYQGGFLVGLDTPFSFGNVNLFAGATFGKAEENYNIQTADVNNYLGGVSYEMFWCDNFIGLAVTAGYSDWSNKRYVMNNLAAGGVQTARFDKGGAFVSPEVTIAHSFTSVLFSPVASFTARYAGLWLGDINESGSLTNFATRDRKIGLVTTKLEVGLPFTDGEHGCCWSVEPYAGIFGRFQVQGHHVNGTFFTAPVSFDIGDEKDIGAFTVGCRGVQTFNAFSLFANVEASWDDAKSSRVLAEAGFGFSF